MPDFRSMSSEALLGQPRRPEPLGPTDGPPADRRAGRHPGGRGADPAGPFLARRAEGGPAAARIPLGPEPARRPRRGDGRSPPGPPRPARPGLDGPARLRRLRDRPRPRGGAGRARRGRALRDRPQPARQLGPPPAGRPGVCRSSGPCSTTTRTRATRTCRSSSGGRSRRRRARTPTGCSPSSTRPASGTEPIVAETIVDRLMRRFARAGTRADLIACAALLEQAPSPEEAARLLAALRGGDGRPFARRDARPPRRGDRRRRGRLAGVAGPAGRRRGDRRGAGHRSPTRRPTRIGGPS